MTYGVKPLLAACNGDAMPAPADGIFPDPACGAAFWAAGFAWGVVELLLLIILAGLAGLVVGLAATPVLAGAVLGGDTGFSGCFAGGFFGTGAFTATAGFLLVVVLATTVGFFAGADGFAALFVVGCVVGFAVGFVADLVTDLVAGLAAGLLAAFDLVSGLRDGAAGLALAAGLDLTTGLDAFFTGALTVLPALTTGLPEVVFFAVFVLAIVGTLLSR